MLKDFHCDALNQAILRFFWHLGALWSALLIKPTGDFNVCPPSECQACTLLSPQLGGKSLLTGICCLSSLVLIFLPWFEMTARSCIISRLFSSFPPISFSLSSSLKVVSYSSPGIPCPEVALTLVAWPPWQCWDIVDPVLKPGASLTWLVPLVSFIAVPISCLHIGSFVFVCTQAISIKCVCMHVLLDMCVCMIITDVFKTKRGTCSVNIISMRSLCCYILIPDFWSMVYKQPKTIMKNFEI